MTPGQSIELAGYDFKFVGIKDISVENYTGHAGTVQVSYDGKPVATMVAEKRMYVIQRMPMTEAAVDAGWTRDLFVALGEPFDDGSWALRIYHKPFIRWIWFGGLFIAFGALCSMMDKRYRARRTVLNTPEQESELTVEAAR
jgi:cytochrome c-type biogenesis protein CcmF